jgi:archaellum component FlaG (FlaF/FlaG flagellin family)
MAGAAIVSIVIAVTAIINAQQAKRVAIESNRMANEANEISNQANTIAGEGQNQMYELNAPNIVAVSNQYTGSSGKDAESIIVKNTGGRLNRIECYCSTIISLYIRGKSDTNKYISIYGFFDPAPQKTGEVQGSAAVLIFSNKNEDNLDELNQIEKDFVTAASEDRYEVGIDLIRLFSARYRDFKNKEILKYFTVSDCDYPIDTDEAWKILILASDNYDSLKNSGLDLNLYSLEGASLWNWYKNQISLAK